MRFGKAEDSALETYQTGFVDLYGPKTRRINHHRMTPNNLFNDHI